MASQQVFHNIFSNKKRRAYAWIISTLLLIVSYPLYLIPLTFISLFFTPTQAVATIFRIGVIIGIVLIPSIIFVDFRARANWFVVALWFLLVPTVIAVGSIPYSKYQQTTRENFAQNNIPAYENARLQEIKYSSGHELTGSSSTTITYNLPDADSKFTNIVDFYHQELPKKGWIDDRREDEYQNEAYWESQPGHPFTGEDWYLEIGPGSTDYYQVSIQKASASNNQYSVSIYFNACSDKLCRIEKVLLKPTLKIAEKIGI